MTRSATVSDTAKTYPNEKSSYRVAGHLEAFGVNLARGINASYLHRRLECLYD